ncbi:hypothetical protein RHABOEDO_000610 [Candidatus Rhabdochlamydia oedothoracis]|uniref:Uncharacterized protein n=1 Tax=Candidatus Rhabdochlamydia oedothoracis TaxID=2720720 RepID=A0ABX8UZQ0_9BACT|nr:MULTISPECIES: hypothetical protein [Rhabdochlamydia]KAG6559521.1 hypothetical protein RHOW815_000454 [Candidatus Rhabdochlamydia sp. W815]MCL6756002.1 hypothetical protein [Candidatus Rhabdochlamydia oedothoracis]QYF48448.1 hypothetical protein RHABOEDO_000610 [Candidatus Rhabdochlamydia oedothoracis]
MDKSEELLLNSLSKEEKATYFSQIGIMQDPSLTQLREQIKNVMLPLLLKVFQLKIHINKEIALNASPITEGDGESIIHKLKLLDKDIKTLMMWCQACIEQIQEALNIDPQNSRFKQLHSDFLDSSNKRWWHKFYKKLHNKVDEI